MRVMIDEIPERCPVCRQADPHFVCREGSHAIFHCVNCHLYFVYPLPPGEGLEYFSDPLEGNRVRTRAEPIYLDGLKTLEGLCGSLTRRLVDVGCGFGLFVEMATQRGWEACGVDPDSMVIQYGRNNLGLSNLMNGDLISVGFPASSFSVVTMWNVLEHVTDPVATLSETHRVLSDDGIFLARVPNMLVFETARRIARVIPLPRLRRLAFLGGVHPPRHLYGFTPSTLRRLLEQEGFEVIRIQPAVARHTLTGASRFLASILYSASIYINNASVRDVVIFPTMLALARKRRRR